MLRPVEAPRALSLLVLGIALLTLVQGCVFFRKSHRPVAVRGCQEQSHLEATNNPPLNVPAGLSAPDTRNAIKIPTLSDAERVRGRLEPCLAEPPKFGPDLTHPPATSKAQAAPGTTPPAAAKPAN